MLCVYHTLFKVHILNIADSYLVAEFPMFLSDLESTFEGHAILDVDISEPSLSAIVTAKQLYCATAATDSLKRSLHFSQGPGVYRRPSV